MTALPLGDPQKPWWTYADLAAVFGLHHETIRRERMEEWTKAGFPLPVPYSLREKRWRPAHVLAWRERYERDAGCCGKGPLRVVRSAA